MGRKFELANELVLFINNHATSIFCGIIFTTFVVAIIFFIRSIVLNCILGKNIKKFRESNGEEKVKVAEKMAQRGFRKGRVVFEISAAIGLVRPDLMEKDEKTRIALASTLLLLDHSVSAAILMTALSKEEGHPARVAFESII